MEKRNAFDELNIPLFLCDRSWKIVFKNRAAKRFMPVPRTSSNFGKYFEKPEEEGKCTYGIKDFRLDGVFRRAVSFDYHGNYALLFFSVLKFNMLSLDFDNFSEFGFEKELVDVLDVFASNSESTNDRYMFLERVKESIFSVLNGLFSETYMLDPCAEIFPIKDTYRIIREKAVPTMAKAGYKTEIDTADLELGYDIYTDVRKYAFIFLNFLLFVSSLSDDKKCVVKVTPFGKDMINVFKFNCRSKVPGQKSGNDLSPFLEVAPYEYVNIRPFEFMCSKLGWNVSYRIKDEGERNAELILNIGISDSFGSMVYEPPVFGERNRTHEDVIKRVIEDFLFFIH